MECSWKYKISIFNVVLVVPIECYSCGWQSAVESSLFHQVKSNFHFWQVKSNLYFQQVKSNFYFQQVKSIFYFWQVPAKFPLVTSSACLEAVNQAIYWSTHFLSISPSSFSMMLLKHIISLNFVNFNLRYRIWCFKLLSILFLSLRYYHWRHLFEANWSRYYLTFSLFCDIYANVGDDADVGVGADQTWELSKNLHDRIFG